METIVFFCGLFHLGFAVFHVFFWKIFRWEGELEKLHFANKAIMQILNIQLIFYFLFVAFLCFWFPNELLTTKLGSVLLGGTSAFWLLRAVQQFIFLRINHATVHLLTVLFFFCAALFALPLVMG